MPARGRDAHARTDHSPAHLLLALITGAWCGQAYSLFAPLDPMASPEIVDNRTADAEFAVRAFFDGVKHFFATGDAADIRGVVAENFVDQVRLPVADSGREGFVRHLGAVRRAFPGLQIEPAEIAGHGDTVAVRLEVAAGTASTVPRHARHGGPAVGIGRGLSGRRRPDRGEVGGAGGLRPVRADRYRGLRRTGHGGCAPDTDPPLVRARRQRLGRTVVGPGADDRRVGHRRRRRRCDCRGDRPPSGGRRRGRSHDDLPGQDTHPGDAGARGCPNGGGAGKNRDQERVRGAGRRPCAHAARSSLQSLRWDLRSRPCPWGSARPC